MTTETIDWAALLAKCSQQVIQDLAGIGAERGAPRRVFPEAAFQIKLRKGADGQTDLTSIVGGIPDVLPNTLQTIEARNKAACAISELEPEPVAVVFRGLRREDLFVFYGRREASLVLQFLPGDRQSKITLLSVESKRAARSGTLGGGMDRIEFTNLPQGSYLVVSFSLIDLEALQQRAIQLRHGHHFDDALALLEEALEVDPKNYMALTRKGCVLRGMGRSEEAKAAVEEALQVEPGCALAWRAKGALLRDDAKHQEGLDCYLRSLELDPTDHLCWENKGNALLALGRDTEAAEAYAIAKDVKKLHPEERY